MFWVRREWPVSVDWCRGLSDQFLPWLDAAFDEMEYHPHQFVYMVERGEIEKLAASPSIYKCLSCFACVDRCPRGVEPAKLVEAVRLSVIRKQGQNHFKPTEIPAMLEEDMPQQLFVSALRKYSK